MPGPTSHLRLFAAAAAALRRLGQPRRRRCCWCMAAGIIAATGTGSPSVCATTSTSSRPTCAAMATANGRPSGNYSWRDYRLRPRPARPPAATWRRSPSSPIPWAATSRCAMPGYIPRRCEARRHRGARPLAQELAERLNAEPIAERMRRPGSRSSAPAAARSRAATPRWRTRSSACRRRTSTSRPSRRAISPSTASTRTRTAPKAGSSTMPSAWAAPPT